MPLDGEAVGKSDAAAGRMTRIAPVPRFEQYRVKHSEFDDLAADAVDLHPVP